MLGIRKAEHESSVSTTGEITPIKEEKPIKPAASPSDKGTNRITILSKDTNHAEPPTESKTATCHQTCQTEVVTEPISTSVDETELAMAVSVLSHDQVDQSELSAETNKLTEQSDKILPSDNETEKNEPTTEPTTTSKQDTNVEEVVTEPIAVEECILQKTVNNNVTSAPPKFQVNIAR